MDECVWPWRSAPTHMKALITGADGLLGGNLARELLSRGHTVRALVRPKKSLPQIAKLNVEIAEGDITRPAEINAATEGVDLVFHCAACTDFRADPKHAWNVNLEGTRHVADACLDHGVKRLLFIGSASTHQFGTATSPGTEASPFPREYHGVPYMESKHASAELVREYVKERGLDAVILSPTFMFGLHDHRPTSGELIKQWVSRGLRFVSPGGRNIVHVEDVCKAIASAVDAGKKGETYLLAGHNVKYRDLFGIVAETTNTPRPLGTLPAWAVKTGGFFGERLERLTGKPSLLNADLARFACYTTCYSAARAIKELGMPQTSVERAIADCVQSLREDGHIA